MTAQVTQTVSVIGLGAMGLPMALRLNETMTVRAFDLSSERTELGRREGLEVFDSAAKAAADSEVIMIVVRNGAQLEDAIFGAGKVAESASPGSVIMVTSTVGIDVVKQLASRLAEHDIEIVDAPLSGGPVRAGLGDLLIVVGGSEKARKICQPILDSLASTLSIVGNAAGDGQALKTVNQLLCGIHIAAAAEALALADSLGLDLRNTLDALNAGAAGSFMLGNRGPRMIETLEGKEPEVMGRLDIFVKDLGIVTDASRKFEVPTPIASVAEQIFRLGLSRGLGAADDSAVIKVILKDEKIGD
jgi:3-hydroxyisobutyrate dehydrogenase